MPKTFLFIIFIIKLIKNSSPTRNLQESSDDIIILHLNDVHCGVNDTIGYDGLVLYRDELKKKYSNIITVDIGDHAQGGILGIISDGTAIIKIMNKVGFDVAILGNHEFDYGLDKLKELRDDITSKYICANFCYQKNKTAIFDPYKIIEKGGKKIAFIGVLTPLAFSRTYLSTLRDSNGEPIYDFLSDNNAQELYDRIQKYINELRNIKKVDYVILLTHIGMKEEQYTSDGLLSKLENVDAVLDGHTHRVYNITTKDKNSKDIHISQAGTKLKNIGKLIIKKDGTISSEMISEIPEPIDKSKAIKIKRGKKEFWVDKDMNNFINSLWDKYKDELNIQYGILDYDLIIRPENNSDSDLIYCRYQECTLGNLIADSIKNAGNGELSIVNGGIVRNNLNKGNLTRGDLMTVLPWFNNIVLKKLPGECILDALEYGVSKLPNSSGAFPQVSGISYEIDVNLNSTVLIDSDSNFLNVTGKRRVFNVKINGEDLDLNRYYYVSLIDFIANGGDGYSMFAKYEVYNESLMTDTDSLDNYIKNDLNGSIPLKYKDLQGRIIIINNSDINSLLNKKRDRWILSTGEIIAIIVPLVIILIVVSIIAIIILYSIKSQYHGYPILIRSESNV